MLEEQAAKDGKPIPDLRVAHLEHVAKLSRIVRVKRRRLAIASFQQEFRGADNRAIRCLGAEQNLTELFNGQRAKVARALGDILEAFRATAGIGRDALCKGATNDAMRGHCAQPRCSQYRI